MMWYERIIEWLAAYPVVKQLLLLGGLVLAAYFSYLITKRYIIKWLDKWLKGLAQKTKFKFDDILFKAVISRRLAYLPPLLIFYYSAYLVPAAALFIQRLCLAVIVLIVLLTIGAFFRTLIEHYEKTEQFKDRPIKGYVQVVILLVYILGLLVMVGILTGQPPWILLSGVGALTAVIILIFRDTILSFIASLQISSYDLVRLNDWIEVPRYGADGDVVEIALHTVKVQNWDKTITLIPTHKLIDETFKNWRGMQESGGRRIKRSIYIDIDSIRFCDEAMLAKFEQIHLLKDYLKKKREELDEYKGRLEAGPAVTVNFRHLTNIGTFRAYIQAYLRNHSRIHQQLTFLIRQLQPGPTGLPIEIYVFANDTRWAQYEAIQADIFDHLLAVVREFNLRVFQYPTNETFEKLNASASDGSGR